MPYRHAPLVAALLAFALVLPIFNRLIESGDHDAHIAYAMQMARGQLLPPHPLFHSLLFALAGRCATAAGGAAAFLIAAAIAARAWLTAGALTASRSASTVRVVALALMLTMAMPLPNWWGRELHLGQPSNAIWHNPTEILCVPFALATFYLALRLMAQPSMRRAALVGVVMTLCLLAKPNYVLAFGPCFGPACLAALWRAWGAEEVRFARAAGVAFLAFAPAVAVLGWQARWLAGTHPVFLGYPLVIWQRFTPSIPASILLGIAFPLAVAVCYPRTVNADRALGLAWSSMAVAIATFAMLSEAGGRPGVEGNWGWGCHLAAAVLFVESAACLLRQPASWRRFACFGLLAMHAASGAGYVGWCLARGRF